MVKKVKAQFFAILLCLVSVFALCFSACKEPDPITGIAATFTQTEEIFESDELTKIKPMLKVVTKSQAGVETETNQYTLEGKFTAGDSVITIVYMQNTALTTTVTVRVSKDAHVHMYGSWAIIAQPTCTDVGYMQRNCSCGDTQRQEIKESGHAYGEWVTIEPTCTKDGEKYRVCGFDSTHVERETIKASGHTNVVDAEVEPTCTLPGKTEGAHCSVCDTTTKEQERIPEKGHAFGEWVTITPSTETEHGTQRRDCEVCEEYETSELPLKGHEYVAGETVAPTCTSKGYTVYNCTSCSDSYQGDFVDVLPHDVTSERIDPTCETVGYTAYTCQNCQYSYVTNYRAANGHDFDNWVIEKSATCQEAGMQTHTCLVCPYTETVIIPQTGHKYILMAVYEQNDGAFEYVYECEYCGDEIVTVDEEGYQAYQDTQLFEQAPNFQFVVVGTEAAVREELSIINAYYLDTEYEEYKSVVQNYDMQPWGGEENTWLISPNNDMTELDPNGIPYYESQYYVEGETFVARIGGDVSFYGYYTPEHEFTRCYGESLTFSIAFDEGKSVVELKDNGTGKVLFLRTLENHNPGYYPYTLDMDDSAECGYLTLQKIDDISVGSILFIGEAESVEEIFTIAEEDCLFGKVESIHKVVDGYCLVLSCPELYEVFSDLNVGYDTMVDFSEYPEVQENIESQAVEALYASEDFAKFIATADITTQRYYAERQLAATALTKENFADKVTIDKPEVKVNGTEIVLKFGGHYKSDVKTKADKDIGEFSIDFTVETSVGFNISVDWKLKYWWFVPTGVDYFDIALRQTDSFKLDFEVKFDVDYELDKDNLTQKYVYHKVSKKIHIQECIYIKDTAKEKLGDIKAEELSTYAKKEGFSTCLICKPVEGLNRAAFIINTSTGIVHCYNCYDVQEQMNEENKQLFYGNIKSLKDQYDYCQRCQPELRDKLDYEKEMLSTLEYADWAGRVGQITDWAKSTGAKEYNAKGMKLCDFHFTFAWVCTANFELRLVLNFDFEASLEYHYYQKHENTFGVRVQGGALRTYSSQKTLEDTSDFTMMGSLDFKVGLQTDVYASVLGLSHWLRAGFTAEAGMYLKMDGIVHITKDPNVNNYAAAYFESGPYVDVSAYYHVFKWSGNASIYKKEFALFVYGYDKAYYGYVNEAPEDIIKVDDKTSYELDLTDILSVYYYDVQEHKTDKETLKASETALYQIVFEFGHGEYWTVQDNKLKLSDKALCEFTDTLTIRIVGNTTWKKYVKGSAAFFLSEIKLSFEVKDGEGHQYDETIVPKTCYNDGCYIWQCEKCPSLLTEVIPASHEACAFEGIETTCLKSGWTPGEYCSVCLENGDEVILSGIEEIPALGHGFTGGICVRCGALEGTGFYYLKQASATTIESVVICTANEAKEYYQRYPEIFTEEFTQAYNEDFFNANAMIIFSYRTDKLGSTFAALTADDVALEDDKAILTVTETTKTMCAGRWSGETGVYDIVCALMKKDEITKDTTAVVDTVLNLGSAEHLYELLTFDVNGHWFECYCGQEKEGSRDVHGGGKATCLEKAKCSVCYQEYGEIGTHDYENGYCTVCYSVEETRLLSLDNAYQSLPCVIVRTYEEACEYYTNYSYMFTEEFIAIHSEEYFRFNALVLFSHRVDQGGPIFENEDVSIDVDRVILNVTEHREEYCAPMMGATVVEYNNVCVEILAKDIDGCTAAEVNVTLGSLTLIHSFVSDICYYCGAFSGEEHTITLYTNYNNNGQFDVFLDEVYPITYSVITLDSLELPTIPYWKYKEYQYFLGWYTNMAATEPFDIMTLQDNPRDITLYAKWDLCTVYTSVASTPETLTDKNIILDWSNEESGFYECNRTIILQNVSRVHWIGGDIVFIGLNIAVTSDSDTCENVLMSFYNIDIHSGCLYQSSTSSDINLTLQVEGENSIDAPNSLVAIGDFNELTIIGSGNLSVSGGDGLAGSDYGAVGEDGASAIETNVLTIDIQGTLDIYGGNGGDGATGRNGAHGRDADAFIGNAATNGEDGGRGGDGGKGAAAIQCEEMFISETGTVRCCGGAGGKGGNGGNGGNGGEPFYDWFKDTYGGAAGNPGAGGDGCEAIVGTLTTVAENVELITGANGKPGQPGLRGADNG